MAKKIGKQVDLVGDEAVKKATGHSRSYWFGELDKAGAKKWSHKEIAAFVIDELGVEPWWGQGIAIDYEQERGLRQPGQRSDGSFAVTATKTIGLPKSELLDAVVELLTSKLGQDPTGISPNANFPTARFKLESKQVIAAMIQPKGEGKCSVSLEWRGLADANETEPKKAKIREWLGELT